MQAMIARVVPHIMRLRVSRLRGLTTTLLASTLTSTSSDSGIFCSPSLPFAVIMPPAMATCTPAGISTGYFPTRDIRAVPLEHAAEDFAANIGSASLGIAHHALRRGQDGNTQAGIDPRQFLDLRIHAAAGLGDAIDLLDDRFALIVLQLDAQLRDTWTKLLRSITPDEALTLQHTQHVLPQLRRRRHTDRVARALSIADAGQHIPDGIGHGHLAVPLPA